jgi:hypothetical protein
MFLLIFISITYVIKFSIYLRSTFFFLSFRATVCFTNPVYRLIRMTPLQLLRISVGSLSFGIYALRHAATRCGRPGPMGDSTLQPRFLKLLYQ